MKKTEDGECLYVPEEEYIVKGAASAVILEAERQ